MRTTVLIWPGCAWHEVAPAVALLAPVREVGLVAVAPGEVRVREGYRLVADGGLGEGTAPGDDDAELLVPGGEIAGVLADADALRRIGALARAWLAAGRTVGAVGAGVTLLGAARALDGRAGPSWTICTPTAHVVRDGPLLTAMPWASLRFARELAESVVPDAAAAARTHAGTPDLPGVDPYERWVIELRVLPGVVTTREHVRAHVQWLSTLEADGRLVAAGPFPEDAAGMLVLRVPDRAEAERLVHEDPFVRAGVRAPSLRRWLLSCADNRHLGALG